MIFWYVKYKIYEDSLSLSILRYTLLIIINQYLFFLRLLYSSQNFKNKNQIHYIYDKLWLIKYKMEWVSSLKRKRKKKRWNTFKWDYLFLSIIPLLVNDWKENDRYFPWNPNFPVWKSYFWIIFKLVILLDLSELVLKVIKNDNKLWV